MGDLADGPAQGPLDEIPIQTAILALLPTRHFDLIYTHNPTGEYTRHLRHEEVSRAVIKLWHTAQLFTRELRTFAYEDGDKAYYPRAQESAPILVTLPPKIWNRKYELMTKTYGYDHDSWEAMTTPKSESFWKFSNSTQAIAWLQLGGKR